MKLASVIIRFSNRSRPRERNLGVLLSHLHKHQQIETIMSVMDKDISIPPWVVKRFTSLPFESSKANNIGAAAATTNIFIFQDADIIFKLDCYDRMIAHLQKEYESARVGEKCVNLGEPAFRGLSANADAVLHAKFSSCMRDAPGACIGLTRSAFIRIGGYCELFKVYGWEDVYFRYKVQKLTKQICLQEQMLHMPHEQNYQMDKQPVNAHLYQEVLSTDNGDCVVLSKRDHDALLASYPTLIG